MGLRQSKGAVLSYEEAKNEVGPETEQRLRDAFKRYSNSHQLLHRVFFFREVLGDVIPEQVAEEIYKAFGGGANGVSFKDLFVGLVLLTGSDDLRKSKFLFSLFSNDSEFIDKQSIHQFLDKVDGKHRSELDNLFQIRVRVTFDEFFRFIKDNPRVTSFSSWLLAKQVCLTDNVETKTFYSTLVGVTHLEEDEITHLEHRFWQLKPASGRIDTNVFKEHIGDLLPLRVIEGLFHAFDDNGDEQIDFKEMTCGVSACCRGPDIERQKFCFKIFDVKCCGWLDRTAFTEMLGEFRRAWILNDVCSDLDERMISDLPIEELVSRAITDESPRMTKDDYALWTTTDATLKKLSMAFLDLLSQICHVIFGLPPENKEEEKRVVLHWLKREKKDGLLVPERRFYLLSRVWWERWLQFVSYKSDYEETDDEEDEEPGQVKWDPKMVRNVEALTDLPNLHSVNRGQFNKSCSMTNLSNGEETGAGNYTFSDPRQNLRPGHSTTRESRAVFRDRRKYVSPESAPKEPGPIDNSSLVVTNKSSQGVGRLQTITDEGEIVRPGLTNDFLVLPDKLWDCLMRRYGGGPTLPRMAVRGRSRKLEVELHPIMVRILRHQTVPDRANPNGTAGKGVVEQRYLSQPGTFWSSATQATAVSANGVVNSPRRKAIHLAFFSKVHTLNQIYTFLGNKLHIAREEMRLWLFIEESRMTLLEDEDTPFGRAADQVHKGNGLIPEHVVYDGRTTPLNLLLEVRNKDLTWPEEIYHLTKTGQLHSKRTSLVLGVTGLNNLGNTCFLNAAVQCVSNTEALRNYFKKDFYTFELNKKNPLGMKGHMAWRYGQLLFDLWSGNTCVVAPVRLRLTVSRYASQFSGNSQHDAHEFLAFLLDGLHEDLNRVMVKPYVELKDSDGRDDRIVAKEAWDNHLLRNQSIVVDLFHGLLKSQVECGMCANVSVRFDPFSVLSLPLPMESSQPIDVIVSRQDDSKLVRYRLLLNHDDRFQTVKAELAKFYEGVSTHDILLAEVLNSQIRGFPHDGEKVNRLTISSVYAYIFPRLPDASNPSSDTPSGNGAQSPAGSQEDSSMPSTPSSQPSTITRNYSTSSFSYTGENVCSFDCFIAYHRKMERNDVYFLAHMKARPRLFGLPIVIPNTCGTCEELYRAVWAQVKRLMGPKTSDSVDQNHAFDCDDNSNNPFPFQLKMVDRMGMKCPRCEWFELCRGCLVPCSSATVESQSWTLTHGVKYLAIDWEPTAIHLRYQSSREFDFVVHKSVQEAERRLTEPMDLKTCLDHFVYQEELDDDGYYCNKCKKRQRAKKKLDIWQAPPILIIHLKRFHFVNNRWMKSHKIVNFPRENLDLTRYVVSRRARTTSATYNGLQRPPSDEEDEEVGGRDCIEEALDPLADEAGDGCGGGSHRYKLYGIICHLGALGGGHYISYALNPNNKWYRFNDSSTKEVKESEIDVNSAYILFYERENADWSRFMPSTLGRARVEPDFDNDDEDVKERCCLQ